MLNIFWAFMLLVSVVYGAWSGNLVAVSNAILDSSAQAVSLAISMAGVVALWCGLMEIADRAGIVRLLSRILRPVIGWLFPELAGKEGERAREYITLNFIMNMLGTGWSATGPGLMAMEELAALQKRQAEKEKTVNIHAATDAMCTFLVLNISSLQLIPVNIIAYRGAYGSASPTAIILPAFLATLVSTLAAVIFCKAVILAKRLLRRKRN